MLNSMRHYYCADAIRDAEAPLLASLPDGALMRRAAYGLATAIVGELSARTGGVAGRRVCAVVGSGDNGGDALWAATFLRRRGAAADAVVLNPDRAHRRGWRRSGRPAAASCESVSATTDLVIDGVVGISGSGPLRPAAAEVFAAVDAPEIPVVAVDIPSGVDVETGAITGPAVHAALTVTFGGLKPVHALGDCGRVELDRHRARSAAETDVLGFEAGRRRGALAGAGPARRQVHPGRDRGAGRLGDLSGRGHPVHRRGRRRHLGHGPLRGQRAARGASHWPEVDRRARPRRPPVGCRRGSSDRVWAPTRAAPPRCGSRWTPTCR